MQLHKPFPSEQAPLDYLVVSELEAIISSEKQLQRQYGNLMQASTSEESQMWASEVWRLRLRADRLGRMLDALGENYRVAEPI